MAKDTFYAAMQARGISHRDVLKFCTVTAASLGLAPAMVPKVVEAMETQERISVRWLHGLEDVCWDKQPFYERLSEWESLIRRGVKPFSLPTFV